MSHDYEPPGRDREYARGYSVAPPEPRPPPEPTREQKAEWAATAAANLTNSWQLVTSAIAAMTQAHASRDVAGYERAREQAQAAVAWLRDRARTAKERAPDAQSAQIAKQLAEADQLVEAAEKQLAQAPGAPVPVPPTLSCEHALLAALPPKEHTGAVKQMLDTARREVEQVFRRMPYSDFVAFEQILREFPTHEIAVRFSRRFGREKQNELLAILRDPKERARARAREEVMSAMHAANASAPPAPASAATSLGPTHAPVAVSPPPAPGPVVASPSPAPASVVASPSPAPASVVASPSPAPASVVASPSPAPASVVASSEPVPAGESIDSIVRRMIETETPDDAALEIVDGTTRRAMARRLREYRPMRGDELGALFWRLTRGVREQLLAALESAPAGAGTGREAESPPAGANTGREAASPPAGANTGREAAGANTGREAASAPAGADTGREATSGQLGSQTADTGVAATESPASIAGRGVEGPGQALPHAAQIQAAFGKHDVSGVRAHVGGEAGEAARQLGARAFATGDDVAFAEEPDIELAAHEAVHHVQQRAGVALASTLDTPGDVYEQQADAIAAKVARGESVEADLDAIAGTGTDAGATRAPLSPAHAVVSRETGDAVVQRKGAAAEAGDAVVPREAGAAAVPRTVGDASVQRKASDLVVQRKTEGGVASASGAGLPFYVDKFQNDLRTAVARHLSDTAWPDPARDLRWAPGGDHMFTTRLWQSLAWRLGDASGLRALLPANKLEERFERYVGAGASSPLAAWSPAFGKAVGQLVEWSVRDALVERVGARYRAMYASRRAAPEADELAREVGGSLLDQLVARALVKSDGVDLSEIPAVDTPKPVVYAAGAAGAAGAASRSQVMAVEVSIGRELTALYGEVARLGLGEPIRDARDAHARRVVMLDEADAATRQRYVPVLQFQHAQLLSLGPSLRAAVERYWPLRGVPAFALTRERRAERAELEAQLDLCVRAVASSDDPAKSAALSRELAERVRRETTWKERDRIDAAEVAAETAMDEMVVTTRSERVDREALAVVRAQRQSMLDGTEKGRSRYEREKAVTLGYETALRARMAAARTALDDLRGAALEVFGEPSVIEKELAKLDRRLGSLPQVILDVRDRLDAVERTWQAAIAARTPQVQEDPDAPEGWADWQARAAALPVAQEAFGRIAGDESLGEFLKTAREKIRHQVMVDAIVRLAAALALTVVTGMGAAALGRAVAGALVGEALPLAATSTRVVMAGLRLGIDVGVNVTLNTAVQLALSGGEGSVGAMALENALMEVFTRGLGRPLHAMHERALAYGRELSALPHLSAAERSALATLDTAGTQMVGEVVGNMATQWAARHLVATVAASGPSGQVEVSEPFALTVLQQGAAIGLGRFLHGQLAAFHARRAALESTPWGRSAEARELFAAREAFYARAKELSESLSPDPAAVHELLQLDEALSARERALVASHGGNQPASLPPTVHDAMHDAAPGDTHAKDSALRPPADAHAKDSAHRPHANAHATHAPASDHLPVNARTGEHAQANAASLGARVATEAGVRYLGEGQFQIEGAGKAGIVVDVQRTSGRTGVHLDLEGGRAVIEIERGLGDHEFERALVARIHELRQHVQQHDASHAGQAPDPKATSLIERIGASKAFAEQHAHAPGSVPIEAVLGMVDEFAKITPAQRAEQIHLLESLIAAATGGDKKPLRVRDLSRDKIKIRDGVVEAPEKVTIASVSGDTDLGLLNQMLEAKRALQTDLPPEKRKKAVEILNEALKEYRKTIAMQKPDDTRYDATIDTTNEFFVRYKLIVAHGLSTAEIAAKRASAHQLGMQELRYGSDRSSVATLHAEADELLRQAPLDADVSNTFATTKNRLADPDAAKNEQQLLVEFVKAWETDPTMQRAFNGFDAAGVEDAHKPPALLWEAAAQRTFRNARSVRAHLAEVVRTPAEMHALAERVARATGTSVPEAEARLQRYRTGDYEAAIAATEARAAALRGDGQVATLPALDTTTSQVAETFAGLSIESVAADTRVIVEALRVWSAETGVQRGDVTLLGMTMHAGEQILNEKLDTKPGAKDGPFVLLDQVDQAVSLGADRIGHGLVLGIDPEVLVAKGRLDPARVEAFRARQRQVIEHVRARGVVLEANLSSNTEISNLTQGQHPAGRFVQEGLRVTVNTDDETVLATTVQREFERVSRARGVTRHDLAAMLLEGYRSRLGNRELGQRGRLAPFLIDALLHGIDEGEAVALANHLAHYFRVDSHGAPRAVITRVVHAALGV